MVNKTLKRYLGYCKCKEKKVPTLREYIEIEVSGCVAINGSRMRSNELLANEL